VFDVIDALEILGADADFAGASPACLDSMLQGEGAEPALRSALLQGDAHGLQALLRAPMSLCPLIHPAEEEEEPEDEEEEEDDLDDDDEGVGSRKVPKPRGS
jgi:hypothetical protein